MSQTNASEVIHERGRKRRKFEGTETMEDEDYYEDPYYENESTIIKPYPSRSKYRMKKRTPIHGPSIRPNDIFLSRKSKLTAIYARAKKIFQHELHDGECHIHALGSAITIAVDICLKLQQEFDLIVSPRTETIKLVDDFIPIDGVGEVLTQVRYNSALHITMKLKKMKGLFKKNTDKISINVKSKEKKKDLREDFIAI